jgi:hypothetical protein
MFVQLLGITDTWDLDSRVMPNVSTSFSIRRVLTPKREQVASTVVSARSARWRRSNNQSGSKFPRTTWGSLPPWSRPGHPTAGPATHCET